MCLKYIIDFVSIGKTVWASLFAILEERCAGQLQTNLLSIGTRIIIRTTGMYTRLLIIVTVSGNGMANIRFLPLILHKLKYLDDQKYYKHPTEK